MDGGRQYNIRTELRWFGGSRELAEQHAKEVVTLTPDVIVVNATVGIEAVLKTTRNIPTVFVMVGNPVGSGSLACRVRAATLPDLARSSRR